MAKGRMLRKKISLDVRWADLANDTHRLLFTVGIAHLDIEGRISGDPREFKAAVAPMLDQITKKAISAFFEDASKLGLILRYQVDGRWIIQYPGFKKNQTLRPDKEGPSRYPDPPDESAPLGCKSGTTPGALPEDSGTTPAEEKRSKDKLSEGKKGKSATSPEADKNVRPPSFSADDLARLWNQLADPVFPRVRLPLAENRARKVRPAVKVQPDPEWWTSLFKQVNGTPFLKGQNDRKWRSDFGWVVDHRDKILEGSYEPPPAADTQSPECPSCGGAGYIKNIETEEWHECKCREKTVVNE